jgi:hypothetical protein
MTQDINHVHNEQEKFFEVDAEGHYLLNLLNTDHRYRIISLNIIEILSFMK